MSTKSLRSAIVDGKAEAKSEEPGNDNEVIIPAHLSNDELAAGQPSTNEDTRQHESARGDGENDRATVRKVVNRPPI